MAQKGKERNIITTGFPGVKVKEESEKVGLKLNIQKTTIMASALSRLGAELELRRSGSSLGPSQ